jgi:hypothetical protein
MLRIVAAQAARFDNAPEITFHQSDAGTLHGNICPGAHRNAHMRLRQGGASLTPSPAIATILFSD